MKRPLSWLITLVGILLVLLVSGDIRRHTTGLFLHLASGNWEIVSDKPFLDDYVRAKYKGRTSEWEVSFIAGSGRAYSMLPQYRQSALTEIGQSTLTDAPVLLFGTTPLPEAYGALLQDALGEVADNLDRTSGSAVRRLITSIRLGIEQKSGYIDPQAYKRANAVLAKRPRTDLLRQALGAYEEFAGARGLDFPSFAVGTNPGFDSPNAWDSAAILLPQQGGRCRGQIGSLGADAELAEADVVLQPRLLEVTFDRRWLSDPLLDSLSRASGRSVRAFGQQGTLRLVPTGFWVLMPEAITFSLIDGGRKPLVERWAADGTCCKVACIDSTVRLNPLTVRRQQTGAFRGLRADVDATLYAVVSRRRIPS